MTKNKTTRMKNFYCLLILFLSTLGLNAQVGGDNVFEFLNSPPTARVAGLAGNLITVKDSDIGLGYQNPASLNPEMHLGLAFNYNFHLSGINEGFAAFGYHLEKYQTTLQIGAKFINYGEFIMTDEFGNSFNEFDVSESVFFVGASRQLYEKLSVGANIKVISSSFEIYNSFGLAADLSAMYQDTASNFTITLLAKNIGSQLTAFQDTKEAIPFEMQIGLSKRLKHLPFRWSIIYHNLNRFNILFDDPNRVENTLLIGDVNTEDGPTEVFFNNLGRHLIINGEFLFGKKEGFNLRFGYDHKLSRELTVEGLRSLAGFSFGFGLQIKMFKLDYGHTFFHLAGGTNHISITTNLKRFTKKFPNLN